MTPFDKTPQSGARGGGGDQSPVDLDYELIRMVGRGGYGEVWLVRDKDGQYLACKVVHRESFQHDRPYEREYEGILKFEPVSRGNKSQVKILHVGRRDAAGCFYYIMELADDASGNPAMQPEKYIPRTLKSEIERRGRLPVAECLEIGLSLSAALENLHQHGLIHRDIKPGNIIFVHDTPKLADIGLVTGADVTVSYVGTEGFIPPEGPGSPQADLYGLGKVLYEISTGMDRLEYPELPANFGDLPDRAALLELSSVTATACEADPRKRYASAGGLQADLRLLQDGKSIRQARATKKRRTFLLKMAAACGLILLMIAGGIQFQRSRARLAGVPGTNSPVLPTPSQLAQSESRIRDTYRSQLNGGTSAAKQQAAFDLLERSGMSADSSIQLASLRVASLLATEAGNFPLASQICNTIGERFHTSGLPFKTDLLAEATNYTHIAAKKTELVTCCIQTGFEALGADDYDNGLRLAELATAGAQETGATNLIHEAEFLRKEMTRGRDGFAPVKQFEDILRQKPDDPEAGAAVGKYLCFVKNDWEAGLPLMAHATNILLTSAANAEINGKPTTPNGEIALATLWRNFALSCGEDEKASAMRRVRYWCLKAVAAAKLPERIELQQQLGEWVQVVPTEAGEVHIVSRLEGTEAIDIFSDEIRWKSGTRAMNNRINEMTPGDLKAGDLKIIKNTGATRYMPDAVDFSTARLVSVHKSKRQERAKIEIAADHVRLTFIHQRGGYAQLDVVLDFGKGP